MLAGSVTSAARRCAIVTLVLPGPDELGEAVMSCVSPDSSVYYSGHYWNDLDAVGAYINRQITGHGGGRWHQHFRDRAGRQFRRALILNCGNGWVERELLDAGLVASAVGVDYSEELLASARASAQGLPLEYRQMDINRAPFPDGPFDLVVNHAAAHHIARLDRVFRALCRLLPESGWMVSYDYVGPHRNQWTTGAWEAAQQLNQSLPAELRQDFRYPHLSTMLLQDPTEAVHSELVKPIFDRYFDTDEYVPVGGALAYLLLTHNVRLFSTSSLALRDAWVARILDADAAFQAEHPELALFAYFAGRPRKSALEDEGLLSRWAEEEDALEELAARHGGEYYPLTPQQVAYRVEEAAERHRAEEAERLKAEEGSHPPGREQGLRGLIARAARSRPGRWLRTRRPVRTVEARLRSRQTGP